MRECLACHRRLPRDMYAQNGTRRICQDCYDEGRVTPALRRLAARIVKAESMRRSRARARAALLHGFDWPLVRYVWYN